MYFLIPFINLVGLELVYLKYPKLIYLVSSVIIILTLLFIFKQTKKNRSHAIAIIIAAFLFLIAHYLMLIFLEGSILVHGFIILTSFALFVFLYSLYDKYSLGALKLNYALENIIGYFNLAVFFFLAVGFFHLDLQSNQKFMIFLFLFSISLLALSFSSLDIFNIAKGKGVLYIGVILLIMVEMFWTINLLPISVYSKGALVALAFYVLIGLTKHYLIFGLKEFSVKVVFRYLIISFAGIFLAVITTQW